MAYGSLTISKYTTSDPTVNFIGTWSSTPNASNNTSTLELTIYVTKSTGIQIYDETVTTSITVSANGGNGQIKSQTVTLALDPGRINQQTIYHQTFTVPHDSFGDCSVLISTSVSGYLQATGVQTLQLDHIELPPLVTLSLQSVTETSASLNWWTDSDIDYFWYSTDAGETWVSNGSVSGTSGGLTITGLSPKTTYVIKVKVRRKSNQQTAISSGVSATMYSYPYATSMPDFTIGNSVTINIYNPLNRTVTVKLRSASSDTNIATISTSGKSVSGFNGATAVTALYATIPNATSARYRITVTYGSHNETRNGGYYSVNTAASKPTLNTPTYQDTNTVATGVTGNDQIIVQSKSTPKVTVTGLEAKNSATIASVTASVSGQTITLTRSGTSANGTFSPLTTAANAVCTVTITDSRGLTASKTVTMTVQPYVEPTMSVTARRHNNYYSETDVTVRITLAPITGNVASIRYNGATAEGGIVSGSLTNNVTAELNLDNSYDWSLTINAIDSFGSSISQTLTIGKGTPVIFFDRDKSSVGVNDFPKHEKTFEVDGAVLNRNVITASCGGVHSSGTSSQTISLTGSVAVGDQLTLSSGSVKVGTKIKSVLVSVNCSSLSPTAGAHSVSIYKGTAHQKTAARLLTASPGVEMINISPVLIAVAADDTISVKVSGYASSEYISIDLTVEAMA